MSREVLIFFCFEIKTNNAPEFFWWVEEAWMEKIVI